MKKLILILRIPLPRITTLLVAAAGWVAVLGNPTALAGMESPPPMPTPLPPGGMSDMMGTPGLVPFGIMTGQAGRWMIGYQFMFEKLDGNLVGTRDISEAQILRRFFAAPTDMTMQMHMPMVMYCPTDKLTLMVMLPYLRKDMNHLTVDGERFAERTDGIGDLELRSMYLFYRTKDLRHRLLLNGGLGLPTGSIDESLAGKRLEYHMQLGSGTVSLLPGFTYLGQALPWGWGADFNSTVRLGRNDNGYRLGNRYEPRIWVSRRLTDWVSLSAGASGDIWENVRGADPSLDRTDEQTKDPNLQGGRRLDATFGITFHPTTGFLKGKQFFVQADVPVVQSLDGPQLQRSYMLHFASHWEF